jgi:hypothetical protein
MLEFATGVDAQAGVKIKQTDKNTVPNNILDE